MMAENVTINVDFIPATFLCMDVIGTTGVGNWATIKRNPLMRVTGSGNKFHRHKQHCG